MSVTDYSVQLVISRWRRTEPGGLHSMRQKQEHSLFQQHPTSILHITTEDRKGRTTGEHMNGKGLITNLHSGSSLNVPFHILSCDR